jgi:hypothetical protein
MTHTPQTTTAAPTGTAGERHQLARYPTPHGERTIYAQRVHGRVRVTDRPTTTGRSYLITRHVASLAELNALLADYLDQASRHGDCPMHVRW